jgi:hypothetical protein
MVYDRSSEAKATEDSQLDTTRGSIAKLKRFEEILVKGKSGIVICLLYVMHYWSEDSSTVYVFDSKE